MALPWLIFDLDSITDHPEFNLFESGLPPIPKVFQPLSVFDGVSDIDYKLDQVVAIQDSGVAPVSSTFCVFLYTSAKQLHASIRGSSGVGQVSNRNLRVFRRRKNRQRRITLFLLAFPGRGRSRYAVFFREGRKNAAVLATIPGPN